MRKLVWLALVLGGCGGSNGGSGKPSDAAVDVAVAPDAPPDAPPDAKLIDAPPAPAGHTHFVVEKMMLPATNSQARDYGLDLNGDQTVDNQLGMVIATLSSMGFNNQVTMDKAIDTGATIMLGDLGADDLVTTTNATFTMFQGTNPMPPACASAQDTVCRHHLQGTGSFTIDPTAPVDSPLLGTITASKLTAGPGHLTISFVIGSSAPITVTLLGARVELTSTATMSTGKLAGAISMTDVNGKIIPKMQSGFMAVVSKECTMLTSPPSCGCPANSSGKTLLGLFDTNHDCAISLSEVQNNSLILSLLAPDVTVENMQALSFGAGVHMVNGGFAH
jgi:hypothetical protein